ncbi:MAG TPA: selenide, water dikinase SelD [Candidatus Limnocylindria bacterium]|nr:selenide, water dikinase SelD [Candidatus Limnocylindria bacterium]
MKELGPLRLTEYSHGAGCACKLSPVELGHVLSALPLIVDPNVMVGMAARDDAAVYRIAPDRALVATIDFFTPIVDDPTEFGAIAAANALSDVYAMGAQPLFALGVTAFPREKLNAGLLEKIVSGGAAKMAEAGIAVVGGHSVDDPEPKFGYAVVGEAHPDRIVTHQGAQPGDLLYLTKPLGSGLVTTAIKRGLCPPALEREAVDVMTHLNRDASVAMVNCGATAATDVTGFGLIGHLSNLAGGADIDLAAIPVMEGVRDLAERDLLSGGSRRNHAAYRGEVDWGGIPELDQLMLCDAQTSGGLLVAIPKENGRRFESALASAPYPAVKIGTINGIGSIRVRA